MTDQTYHDEKERIYQKSLEMRELNDLRNLKKRPVFVGNPNHPKPGSRIKVEPIRSKAGILQIKRNLSDEPRNLALFTLGINTAYRANELLSLKIKDVKHLRAGDSLDIYQTKTQKYRRVGLNQTVVDALQNWIEVSGLDSSAPLFCSRKGGSLSVPFLNNLVKKWCHDANLSGNYGSHSLRKTWGYWQRVDNNQSVALLMSAYGHTTEKQTLSYLGIQSDEISALYNYEL